MVREQSHIPTLRSETKLPPRNQDLDPDGDHSIFDESSLATPRCGAYKETQYWDVILSTVGEATIHLKKVLGRHYLCFDTPIAATLWNNWRACRFVEDEGDVVFYKR
ncbi:hypothetical protein HPULCUR_002779 [Helicostylum pulchrum]|uniref:Uncharacterized protein n=1 Tax=Helicostylum pulchrum TaxID=562976 RepID=A0ABP9XSR7_9FUNG